MVMVSSRPDARFSSWSEFFQYNILPLDKDKAKGLVSKLEYDRLVKRQFLQKLEENLYEKHTSFASNPLLLTMMLLTYEQIAEIPNKIHLFYEQAFLTLFNKHDSLKSLYKRKSFSGLPLDEFKTVLSSFSILSYSDRKYSFTQEEIDSYLEKSICISGINANTEHFLNDLLDSVCIMQRDGLGYTFTHRSFQEYFTALYLVGMVNENKYEIFDKIAFVNDRDDVIPMIYDINSDLLEQEWIIPRLESLVSDFSTVPSTEEGKLITLSKLFKALVYKNKKEDGEAQSNTIAYRLYNQDNDHCHFLFLLQKIYSDDMIPFLKRSHTDLTDAQQKVQSDLFRLDFPKKDRAIISIKDLSELKKSTKDRIVKSGCCNLAVIRVDYAKYKLISLKTKHSEKQSDVAKLLLGAIS